MVNYVAMHGAPALGKTTLEAFYHVYSSGKRISWILNELHDKHNAVVMNYILVLVLV